MLTVRFIRHGESLANAGGVTGEPAGIPLTARGREQAQALSHTLGEPPGLIVTSPYIRARDTAAPAAARFPHVPLEVWPVHEFDCIAPARRMHTTTTDRLPWVEAFWDAADPHRCDGDGAECYADFVARVRAALDRLAALPAQAVVVYSHGLFMKAVRWEIIEGHDPIGPETMRAFRAYHHANPIDNAQGFTIRREARAWRILEDRRSGE